MSGKLIKDSAVKIVQIFVPYRVQVVTATEQWTPESDDIAFCCVIPQGIKINAGTEFDWPETIPLGIAPGFKFTFSDTSVILVM